MSLDLREMSIASPSVLSLYYKVAGTGNSFQILGHVDSYPIDNSHVKSLSQRSQSCAEIEAELTLCSAVSAISARGKLFGSGRRPGCDLCGSQEDARFAKVVLKFP